VLWPWCLIRQREPGRARGPISPLALVSGRASPLPAFSPELDSLAESAGFTRFGRETPLQVPFVAL